VKPVLTAKTDLLRVFDPMANFLSILDERNAQSTINPYINRFPGKKDMKPEPTLWPLLVEESGHVEIKPVDRETLEKAFTFKPDIVVPGFDSSIFQDTSNYIPPIRLKLTLGKKKSEGTADAERKKKKRKV
jgi:hypothetical protein